jgi:site-specific recombinase XerD
MLNALTVIDDFEPLVELTIKGLSNDNTRRSYRTCILDFLRWWTAEGKPPFCKDVVLEYRFMLSKGKLSISSINLRLNVVRRLAIESLDAGLMSSEIAGGIMRIKGLKNGGTKTGNWLTIEQSERLINAPDTNNPIGIRDRAILACMLGAGIRRTECANLQIEQIQQREGRWCICDLLGKGNRIRTIPIAGWVWGAIDAWALTGKVHTGCLFYSLDRAHGRGMRRPLTGQGIFIIVRYYARRCGIKVKPHDLRRSFAKLAYRGKADLVQIQASLGHSDPKTTMRYLGNIQDFVDAPADHLGLNL